MQTSPSCPGYVFTLVINCELNDVAIDNFQNERVLFVSNLLCLLLEVIFQTREGVSSDIQTLRSRLKKRGAADFFSRRLLSVWISGEKLSSI